MTAFPRFFSSKQGLKQLCCVGFGLGLVFFSFQQMSTSFILYLWEQMPFYWKMFCISVNVIEGYRLNCTCINLTLRASPRIHSSNSSRARDVNMNTPLLCIFASLTCAVIPCQSDLLSRNLHWSASGKLVQLMWNREHEGTHIVVYAYSVLFKWNIHQDTTVLSSPHMSFPPISSVFLPNPLHLSKGIKIKIKKTEHITVCSQKPN